LHALGVAWRCSLRNRVSYDSSRSRVLRRIDSAWLLNPSQLQFLQERALATRSGSRKAGRRDFGTCAGAILLRHRSLKSQARLLEIAGQTVSAKRYGGRSPVTSSAGQPNKGLASEMGFNSRANHPASRTRIERFSREFCGKTTSHWSQRNTLLRQPFIRIVQTTPTVHHHFPQSSSPSLRSTLLAAQVLSWEKKRMQTPVPALEPHKSKFFLFAWGNAFRIPNGRSLARYAAAGRDRAFSAC